MFKKKTVVKENEISEKTGVIEANVVSDLKREPVADVKKEVDPLLESALAAYSKWRGGISTDAMISLPAWNIEVEKAGLLFSIFSELHLSAKKDSHNFEVLLSLMEKNNDLLEEILAAAKKGLE